MVTSYAYGAGGRRGFRAWTPRLLVGLVVALLTGALLPPSAATAATPVPTVAVLSGAIEQLTLDDPGDVWSGGWLRVGGQDVVLPRNLLIDLPANRLTLAQLYSTAPQACLDRHETGLAASDACLTGSAGFATVQANRTSAGDVIAGDVFIEKGREVLTGAVTSIDYDQGWFTVGGNASNPGTMVRLNDPTGRHTVQSGKGCATGSRNCSADPRFALDAENYTSAFSTGYPLCLPSTQSRTFTDVLDLNGDGDRSEKLTAKAGTDGTGDLLCPDANRGAGDIAADSRRLAPLQVGDSVTVRGNRETVGGVTFLSAFSTKVGVALGTTEGADQPDYVALDEMFIDAPAFQRQRIRDLFIGATTEVDSDVLLWSVHRDPATNKPHEFALGSVLGCEIVAGPLTCRRVLGPHTFRVRHETLLGQGAAKTPKLSACDQLRADDRFAGWGTCPNGGTAAEEFGVLSPLPHEVVARTGRKTADLAGPRLLRTLDLRGAEAPNGEFTFPMGIGLGGIEVPNFAEIDINKLGTPTSFDGIPWDLDRRLSPNGCIGPCESTPQPLDPFPFSGFDPRLQGGIPDVPFSSPHYTASRLSATRDRVLSYVDPQLGKPDGDRTVLAWPPVDPPAVGAAPPPPPTGTKGLVTGLTPSTGSPGTTVLIDGVGLSGATAVSFAGQPAAAPTVVSDFEISAVVPAGATSGPVTVTTPSGTLTSAVRFTVVPPPTVTALSPSVGLGGTSITVSGSGFATADSVTIGGVATAFTVLSDTSLRTTVPMDATTGPVVVTGVGGTGTSPGVFTVTPPPPAPTVTGFTPSNGPPGTVVTVTGTNLGTTTGVYFGGAASLSVSATSTSVTAVVPAGAFSGVVSVLAAGGGATSSAAFQVTAPTLPPVPPTVTSLSPTHGGVGTSVLITGTDMDFATGVSFNGMPATFQQTSSGIMAVVPAGATTGPVVVTSATAGPGSGTAVFTVDSPASSAPAITSFAPSSGPTGTTVVVTGTGLSGTSAVSVNGTPAASFAVLSPTAVSFVVGKKATTGPVRLSTPAGVLTSSTPFVVGKAAAAPTVSGLSPLAGPVGTTVTVTGSAFTGATAVTVGGTAVTSFKVLSASQLSLVVAPGTTSGPVKVTTPGGTATSTVPFTVTTAPGITSFTPTSGNSGTTVVVTGTGLDGATAVTVGGTKARSYTVQSPTQLTLVVGTGTKTGPVQITTPRGTATSTVSFTITGKAR